MEVQNVDLKIPTKTLKPLRFTYFLILFIPMNPTSFDWDARLSLVWFSSLFTLHTQGIVSRGGGGGRNAMQDQWLISDNEIYYQKYACWGAPLSLMHQNWSLVCICVCFSWQDDANFSHFERIQFHSIPNCDPISVGISALAYIYTVKGASCQMSLRIPTWGITPSTRTQPQWLNQTQL